jgi:hypothetical protein
MAWPQIGIVEFSDRRSLSGAAAVRDAGGSGGLERVGAVEGRGLLVIVCGESVV